MNKNKIAKELMIVLLMFALAFTIVYAVVTVVSNTLQTSWTLNVGAPLELYWADGIPSGNVYKDIWITTEIGLRNTDDSTYIVTDKFTISVPVGDTLPTNCITIEYYDGADWVDMTSVLTGWEDNTITGYFGPITGFTVDPGYDEVTLFRIMFDGNAPLTAYSFSAWVEQYPT